MKISELKDHEFVQISKADFEELKRQAFKHAVTCLADSIKENFPDGDEVGEKLKLLVNALCIADKM